MAGGKAVYAAYSSWLNLATLFADEVTMRVSTLNLPRLLFVVLALLMPAAVGAAEPITLPGAVWAIVPPPGFTVVTQPLAIFRHPSGAMLMVQDSPKRTLTKAEFDIPPEQAGQMRVDEVAEITVNGRRAVLAIAYVHVQRAFSVALMVEGEDSNGAIIAVLPDAAASQVSVAALREAVLTAVERPKPIEARLQSLPFKIGDMAGMRVAFYAVGVMLQLTDGPSDDPDEATNQAFAHLMTIEIPAGTALDMQNDLASMEARLRQEYPDANILGSTVLKTQTGDIAEIRYERRIGASKPVAGVTWFKVIGGRGLVMICQYPVGDATALAQLARVRDGIMTR